MKSKYVVASLTIVVSIYVIYFGYFYIYLGYGLSKDTAVWGQLGDFVGGTLNPLLSFISILLLLTTLSFQQSESKKLEEELNNSRKTEKIRSFEGYFFNLINSQRIAFESFKFHYEVENQNQTFKGIAAVSQLEDVIVLIRSQSNDDEKIKTFLETADKDDSLFSMIRIFYVIVKTISERVSDEEGFNYLDREQHYISLVNFTDFALIRLISMIIQFMDYAVVTEIKGNTEFMAVCTNLGLNFELY